MTDVLIIGSGLSGAVTAKYLSEHGLKVTCLEQGRKWSPEEFPGNKKHYELSSMGPWNANPNIRQTQFDSPIEDQNSDILPMLFHGVGGSTVMYAAHWMRFLPSDFRVKTLDGVADDWPIDYEDLAPFYDQVELDFGVSGIAGDPCYPNKPEYPMPPLPINTWGEKIAHAHHQLGWHWWPGSNAIASRPYQGRRPCVQRSTCKTGCNEMAKAAVDHTHWPAAENSGANLITGARVSHIEESNGMATGVIYHDQDGIEHRLKSDIVILAAHALHTPRLLLLSANRNFPNGLANQSGMVGRNLMMHPLARVIGIFDEPMISWQGHWGQSLYSMEFAETDPSRNFVRGAKWNLGPSGGPLAPALYPWNGQQQWGKSLHENVDKWLGKSATWGITAEDLPNPKNCVTLSQNRVDHFGTPISEMTYMVDDNSKRMLNFMTNRARQSFETAGATETVTQTLVRENGWHGLGTCRMGNDPETSVVDKNGQCHNIPNLLIVDGSIFVTSSSVNPAATIAALALRAATNLVEQRRNIVSSA